LGNPVFKGRRNKYNEAIIFWHQQILRDRNFYRATNLASQVGIEREHIYRLMFLYSSHIDLGKVAVHGPIWASLVHSFIFISYKSMKKQDVNGTKMEKLDNSRKRIGMEYIYTFVVNFE
jgi:hypothetical protein